MSTERNFSPLQLWESGMLENINSESTVLKEPIHLEDSDDDIFLDSEDYQVNVDSPTLIVVATYQTLC